MLQVHLRLQAWSDLCIQAFVFKACHPIIVENEGLLSQAKKIFICCFNSIFLFLGASLNLPSFESNTFI